MRSANQPLLRVENLTTRLPTSRGMLQPVVDVSFTLGSGETLAIVGESGSGKSMLCKTLLGLLPGRLTRGTGSTGRIIFDGQDLAELSHPDLRQIRGKEIAMVLQDPLSALNPTMKIGRLLAEPLRYHFGMSRSSARKRALELLDSVGLPRPTEIIDTYPHQLSGGMRQRVVIAMALASEPKLLIADEPTTALDVTVQAEILNLLERLREENGMAMILVTHDLGLVVGRAEHTAVMYAGRIVELAPTRELFSCMQMPYTKGLIDSVPNLEDPPGKLLTAIPGQPPALADLPAGCAFAPRCKYSSGLCHDTKPPLRQSPLNAGHRYACWHPLLQQEVAV